MATSQKNTPRTAEEQSKMDILAALQMEALGSGPPQRISTPYFEGKATYAGSTLRLNNLGYLAKQGFLTSEEVEKVKVWRSAAAAGTVQVNRPESTPADYKDKRIVDRADVRKTFDIAKGPAAEDSDWEDLGEQKVVEEDYVLVYEH